MSSILLCTDVPVLEHGLDLILRGASELELSGVCGSLDELGPALAQYRPELLLLAMTADMHIGILARLLDESAILPKTILWARGVRSEVAWQAISIGIRGILPRTADGATVITCLERVRDGELWIEKDLTEQMGATSRHALTRREGQMVALLSRGLRNREMAEAMGISEGSTRVYLSRLFQKLGVKDRLELAIYGLRNLAIGVDPMSQLEAADGLVPAPSTTRSFFLNRVSISS